jgi:serine/threonine-protein kinase RsbW
VPTVTVSFTPLPAHVRTARFIAASVGRRAGLAEPVLDEIRLAVSEACSLAVRFHLAQAPTAPVELRLTESDAQFRVQVADSVKRLAPDRASDLALDLEEVDLLGQERIGLAVISGLVDDVTVEYGDSGSVVTMTWPIG